MPRRKSGAMDRYANRIRLDVTQSAANTLTFGELNVGLPIYEKAAFVLHRIEYTILTGYAEFAATTDILQAAVCNDNTITTINPELQAVYDTVKWQGMAWGTPGNADIYRDPLVQDFTGLPEGGILTPVSPFYGAVHSSGFAAAAQVVIRIWFTVRRLDVSEYWDLIETLRAFS